MFGKRSNGNGMKMAIATLLVAMLVGVAQPVGASSQASGEACESRLEEARVWLVERQGSISLSEAVQHVLDVAGAACDIENAPAANADARSAADLADAEDVGTLVEETRRVARCETAECVSGAQHVAARTTEVVGCTLGGSGPGVINADVLGVTILQDEPAAGQWEPVSQNVVEVDGEGASAGGTQVESAGRIRVLGVVPLAANDGDSSATCLQTITVEQDITRKCFRVGWWPFWAEYCEEKIKTTTTTTLEACTGSATQLLTVPVAISGLSDGATIGKTYAGATTIMTVQHDYAEDLNPCEAAALHLDDIVVEIPIGGDSSE